MNAAQRHRELANAVVADILANWGEDPAFSSSNGDECVRVYTREYDFAEAPPKGRKVLVFVEPNGTPEGNLARGVDDHKYGIRVLMMERYTGDETDVPNVWVDQRLDWFQEQQDRLQDEDRADAEGDAAALNTAYPETTETVMTYSPDMLSEQKTLISAFIVNFEDAEVG